MKQEQKTKEIRTRINEFKKVSCVQVNYPCNYLPELILLRKVGCVQKLERIGHYQE